MKKRTIHKLLRLPIAPDTTFLAFETMSKQLQA